MNELTNIKYFIDDEKNHEKCNLSDLYFLNLDYSNRGEISFYRSDFTRSHFENCLFNNNFFGRADFINVCIENTKFISVKFGSCLIKNSFFENVLFKNNNYHGVSIQYSYYKDCVFQDETIITNMYSTTFENCKFINCKFEKASLDNNIFKECIIENTDISECIAENLKFDNCTLNNVFIGATLWATYLYKNTELSNCYFKYRGDFVDIWNDNKKTFNNFKKEGCLFEYYNSIIISGVFESNLFEIFCETFNEILKQSNMLRTNNMSKILDLLLFYNNSSYIPLITYLKIFNFLNEYDWDIIPFEESLIYRSQIYKLSKNIEMFNFSVEYIKKVSPKQICYGKYHLDFDDSTEAKNYIKYLFESTNKYLCNNAFTPPLFIVVSEEKGSIILGIASSAVLALLVSYVVKQISHNIIGIKIENKLSKKIIDNISSSNGDLKILQENYQMAKESDLISNNDLDAINKISDDFTKDKIIDVILNFLF